jgi:hypothetical protein
MMMMMVMIMMIYEQVHSGELSRMEVRERIEREDLEKKIVWWGMRTRERGGGGYKGGTGGL